MVAVDTVSRAMPGGDEDAATDMTKFLDNLARIAGKGESVVIGLHHHRPDLALQPGDLIVAASRK